MIHIGAIVISGNILLFDAAFSECHDFSELISIIQPLGLHFIV